MKINARLSSALAAIMLASLGSGCVPTPAIVSGRDFNEAQLAALRSGSMTKKELFNSLGPPYAIFSPGKSAIVQRGPEQDAKGGIRRSRFEEVDSSIAFSLFPQMPDSVEDYRVYYYYHSKSRKTGVVLAFYIHEMVNNRIEEVFVLVNERSGTTKGVFHRDMAE